MLIFWKGNGVIIVFYFLAILFIPAMIGGGIFDMKDDTVPMYIFELLVALAFAYPIWKYGKKINSVTHDFIDKKTGQDVVYKESHTFFFIPVEYWALIMPLLLVVIFTIAILNK